MILIKGIVHPKNSLILFSLQTCMALMLTSAEPDCGQIYIVVIFALKEAITEANSAECMRTARYEIIKHW